MTEGLISESTTRIFVLECVWLAIDKCKYYSSTKGLSEAFWSTLVAGKDHTGVLKVSIDYMDIFAFLLDTTNGNLPCLAYQPQSKRKVSLNILKSRQPQHIYPKMQVALKPAIRGCISVPLHIKTVARIC